MTSESPSRLIISFALPLVFANLFQQLYFITDAAIIGQYVGVRAFAAVGAVSWIVWIMNAVSRDYGNAISIVASLRVGDRNADGFKRTVAHAIMIGAVLPITFVLLMLWQMDNVLLLLRVPEEIYATANQYALIMVLSFPVGVSFYTASALLRATGNSGVTFTAMAASTIINIALDILFVLVFRWAVVGAAVATWIAQAVAMVIALKSVFNNEMFLLEKRHWRLDPSLLKEIFKLWIPQSLNSFVIALGGVYVQSEFNHIGTFFTAGNSASKNVFSLCESIIMAIQTGTSIFVGQNLGAKQPERIAKGVREIVLHALVFSAVIIGLCWLFGDYFIDLFLSKSDPALYEAAHRVGLNFIHVQVTAILIMTPMYLYRISVQTLGHAQYPMIAGILQMIVRIAVIRFLPVWLGEYAYYFPTVFAWAASLPVVFIPFRIYVRKLCAEKKRLESGGNLAAAAD